MTETIAILNDTTPAQRAFLLAADPARKVLIPGAARRTVGALKRKGYVAVTHRHTSNGYLYSYVLTRQGREARAALGKTAQH